MTACPAPSCARAAAPGGPFCEVHAKAPAGQRGGWLSAAKRKPYDANAIAPRLWIGAEPPFDRNIAKVDVLVLCAQEIQPERMAFEGRVIRCPIPDDYLSEDQQRLVVKSALDVARAVSGGDRALVTCAMGRNRSALVAGLALGQLTTMSGKQVIAHVQKHRARALYNLHFKSLLERIIGDGRQRAPRRAATAE